MKFILTMVALCTTTFTVSAQVLSEQELTNVNIQNITVMEQLKIDSENAFTGRGGFATVGGNGCSYTKIQDAIDDNHTEIRIVEDTYNENVVIDDKDVQLLGGYNTCTDAINDNYNLFHIYISPPHGSGKPALKITGDSTRNYVRMRSIFLSGGEVKGGLFIPDADLGLEIENSIIAINSGGYGGGLSVVNGRTDIYADDLRIYRNRANVVGGGLYCRGSNNNIVMVSKDLSPPIISLNKATNGNGGGAYISVGCTFTNYSGDDNETSGISNNEATGDGGGLYAASGAKVYLNGNRYCTTGNVCYGNNDKPVNLTGNKANSDQIDRGNGGAIYATGNGTKVYGSNLLVSKNNAYYGGAVYVSDKALFQTQTSYDNGNNYQANHCWSKGRCNQITGNKSTATSGTPIGGAFYVTSGGNLQVSRTHVEKNRASTGAAFYVKDNQTGEVNIEGSYITRNGSSENDGYGDAYPLMFFNGGTVQIGHTTIADNYASSGGASVYNNLTNLKMYASIIHDLSGAKALKKLVTANNDEDCLIVNKLGDINDPRSMVADPEFIDRANNDYHINATTSPAVDYCDDANTQSNTQDTDRENRGWNDYTLNNIYGPYDVGADETYANDIIFEDEFE